MRFGRLTAATAALLCGLAQAIDFSPARAPSWPLAVKSPYVNTWLQGEANGSLAGYWPKFWTGQITAWQGFVSVDGNVFNWMGAAPGPSVATQTAVSYTSTKTIFTFDVDGKITLTATFLSPIYPDDLVQQSLQYSYLDVTVKSSDGASHSVSVYCDISGEWASGDRAQVINWDTNANSDVTYHTFNLATQQEFKDLSDQAAWGTWFLATAAGDGVTTKTGPDVDVRGQFASNQTLDNGKDTDFRAINDNWPVFALVKDLGSVSSSEASVLFTLGISQDTVINYQGDSDGPLGLTGLWKRSYASADDAMTAFFNNYATATTAAESLDQKIQDDSVAAAGQDYATITTLAVRQTFGGLTPASGPIQDYVFLKEISSNSDIQTVDVIFPAVPILFYLNSTLVKLLLDPLYENQESGQYPNAYAIHDLGTFPNALGYPAGNDEEMPLEECGNMIIMTLAYAQRTGDTAYLTKHWPRLDQWAGYLVNESLIPALQLSTDDFAGTLANQTNLALKGIIGLKAMEQIANLTGNTVTYGTTAQDYLTQWKTLGINSDANPPHTVLAYNSPDSHGLLYNLYADRLLGLNFVDQEIYDMQSEFYPTVELTYGVALDTRHTWVKSDWEMFAAAIASTSTRDMFIQTLVKWINETPITPPFTDLFDGVTAMYPSGLEFKARPVMGGTFALLALP